MCHDPSSRPPIFDKPRTAASGEDTILTATDSVEFRGFLATPEEADDVAVLVFPDARGLHDFYRQLALRFAEQGHTALAIDYFGRTAGTDARRSGVGFEDVGFDFMAHLSQLTNDGLAADFHAAVRHLREQSGASKVFTIGFCLGGRSSYLSSARDADLAGCIGFYGTFGEMRGMQGPLSFVDDMTVPILALQSAHDTDPDRFPTAAFEQALTAKGLEHEIVQYDAPHSFFDIAHVEHAGACADAWTRVKGFITAHS
jgi:carboxymethylenebutenolidase